MTIPRKEYERILEEIYQEISPLIGQGKIADYIPELACVDVNQFGMAICLNDGIEYIIGNAEKSISIQSISKLYTFALAYRELGEKLWLRLGHEPSGSKFNSLILLEHESGIPRNPFINAGAIVIADILNEIFDNPLKEVLDFARETSGNPNIVLNNSMRNSELEFANRNYALGYFMKSFGNIRGNVNQVIEDYCSYCSLEMSCVDLARSFRFLSHGGINPWDEGKILSHSQSKRTNAILMTCGLYDGVGNFAYRVGIPAKSGVGGGIVGIIPGEMSVAVWSPSLNKSGNSLVGIKALELFTSKTKLSIY